MENTCNQEELFSAFRLLERGMNKNKFSKIIKFTLLIVEVTIHKASSTNSISLYESHSRIESL